MKTCSKCAVLKEESDYYSRKGYVMAHCKECVKRKTRAWYAVNHVEALKRWQPTAAAKRERIKEATFAAYGGYVCACCGETEKKFLSLDHINNDGATFRRSMYGNRNAAGLVTYAWLARKGFPSGYQVLCMNCNHGKRMNNGVCPHKTRCNDYPLVGVEPSGSKRIAPALKLVEDIVSPTVKAVAA